MADVLRGAERWMRSKTMAAAAHDDDLARLGELIKSRLREAGAPVRRVSVSWINSDPAAAELLVEVALPDPEKEKQWGQKGTWKPELVSEARRAIRTATAEYMPWAVSTPRIVPVGG